MRRTTLLLVAIVLCTPGCGDDGTAPDDAFELTVRVADAANNPVPDLELLVLMDSPWYQDGLQAAKAAVSIRWDQAVAVPAELTVEDVAGGTVRKLVAGTLPAGAHTAVWNGEDEDGVHQASGLYWAHLVATRGDTLIYDARQPMYMAIMDFDRTVQGVTDADGSIVLADKRLFPLLYGQVDMQAVNENGDVMGNFPLVPDMRFYLRDPGSGRIERFDRTVTATTRTVELRWAGTAASPSVAAERKPGMPAVRMLAEPEEAPFGLRPPMPNPFN